MGRGLLITFSAGVEKSWQDLAFSVVHQGVDLQLHLLEEVNVFGEATLVFGPLHVVGPRDVGTVHKNMDTDISVNN